MAENPSVEKISVEELLEAHIEFEKFIASIASRGDEYVGEGLRAGDRVFELVGVEPEYPMVMMSMGVFDPAHGSGFLHGFSFAAWYFNIYKKEN